METFIHIQHYQENSDSIRGLTGDGRADDAQIPEDRDFLSGFQEALRSLEEQAASGSQWVSLVPAKAFGDEDDLRLEGIFKRLAEVQTRNSNQEMPMAA